MDFDRNRLHYISWVGLTPSGKGLTRTKTDLPQQEGIQLAHNPQTWTSASAFLWVSSLMAEPTDVGLVSLHNHRSQFLKYPSLFICSFIRFTYWFCLSGEPWPIQISPEKVHLLNRTLKTTSLEGLKILPISTCLCCRVLSWFYPLLYLKSGFSILPLIFHDSLTLGCSFLPGSRCLPGWGFVVWLIIITI